jgi:hypothetical protein
LKLCSNEKEKNKTKKQKMRRAAGANPDANGRADKNGHF